LVDANLSPRVAARLNGVGFEAVHVADVGLLTAADDVILTYADANGLVIVSADTDFGWRLDSAPAAAWRRPGCIPAAAD
jgi:predicted nuclease of predicted toxin-antitoxin system